MEVYMKNIPIWFWGLVPLALLIGLKVLIGPLPLWRIHAIGGVLMVGGLIIWGVTSYYSGKDDE